ncbi:AAA family ATPase [Kineosporia sp. R_H_3]|uniref:AAA family ATPase n=1 Tax=Kineosporia sp. R_H_3 TaxID=1961848 RepID=UPI000B4BFB01|nr:AAA family ATPase [Kineosporia sp. R_H_3]
MRLKRVYIRFYKSFNYDYERKAKIGAKPLECELTDEGWYPHVRVDLDPEVTAVVGANEAGKSHLLDAIEILLKGDGIERRDFCRYSSLYSVESGRMRYPEFGGLFEVVDDADLQFLRDVGVRTRGDQVWFFRPGEGSTFLLGTDDGPRRDLSAEELKRFEALLPAWLALQTDIGLPDSIPIAALSGRSSLGLDRRRRTQVLDVLSSKSWTSSEELLAQVPALHQALADLERADAVRQAEHELGRQLLLTVAKVDEKAFADLADAMAAGREGEVNGIIQQMNDALARHLNLSRWWAQDDQFQLRLSPREYELVFTIRDRTGTDYSFSERSRGLRYFLSYYIQLRAHQRPEGRIEILAMDEPDAYLSSSGQQDLLRILEDFARPENGARQDQVVYVTHSPFLLNRNAGHRIRVVDKGRSDEGTRVVHDATKNHYEPLRSSLGAYVAETAFIGGANLFVEGAADQVLLAGLSTWIRSSGAPHSEVLDLNAVTIVPAGSADSVPYMVYLARGRDQTKPPCVALLDGDEAGVRAVSKLKRGEANGKPLLRSDLIVQLSDWAEAQELRVDAGVVVREPEDLIPVAIAVAGARRYAVNFLRLSSRDADSLTTKDVLDRLHQHDGSMWNALRSAFADRYAEAVPDAHIEKIGFAREVTALVPFHANDGASTIKHNFQALFRTLAGLLRDAAAFEDERRRTRRLDRVVNGFIHDYPESASRDRVNTMLKEIETSLGDGDDDNAVRVAILRIRRDHRLAENPNTPVDDHVRLLVDVRGLKYQERLAMQEVAAAGVADSVPRPSVDRPIRTADAARRGRAVQPRSPAARSTSQQAQSAVKDVDTKPEAETND